MKTRQHTSVILICILAVNMCSHIQLISYAESALPSVKLTDEEKDLGALVKIVDFKFPKGVFKPKDAASILVKVENKANMPQTFYVMLAFQDKDGNWYQQKISKVTLDIGKSKTLVTKWKMHRTLDAGSYNVEATICKNHPRIDCGQALDRKRIDNAFVINKPSYMLTYHHFTFRSELQYDFKADLDLAADVLNTRERKEPLIVRVDIFWKDVQVKNQGLPSDFNFDKVKFIFEKVLRPNSTDMIYVILGTHQPANFAGVQESNRFRYPAEGARFVEEVIKYIQRQGWEERVYAWQVDNEPNIAKSLDVVTNPDLVYRTLAFWLKKVQSTISMDRPTVINQYCVAGLAWTQLGVTDSTNKELFSNLDIMGVDIYTDPPQFSGRFAECVSDMIRNLDYAKENFGYKGEWAIIEMPAGPRHDADEGDIPIAEEISKDLVTAILTNPSPVLIGFFQLKDGAAWKSPDQRALYGDSYGVIDYNGLPRLGYWGAIESII